MPASYDRTSKLLDSYRLSLTGHSFSTVRDLILGDLRRFTELGAHAYAADIRKALAALENGTFALAQAAVGEAHGAGNLNEG